jgi:hypothetical protein
MLLLEKFREFWARVREHNTSCCWLEKKSMQSSSSIIDLISAIRLVSTLIEKSSSCFSDISADGAF